MFWKNLFRKILGDWILILNTKNLRCSVVVCSKFENGSAKNGSVNRCAKMKNGTVENSLMFFKLSKQYIKINDIEFIYK